MFRFTMPDTSLPIPEQSELLREQFASFLKSDALSDIMSILETDLDNISAEYNKRTLRNGKVCEIHDIRDNNSLDKYRYLLYPLFKEIGFININKPLVVTHSLGKIIGIGDLHFDIKGTIGAFFFNVNIEADPFTVSASFDSFFALRIVDRFDFDV